MVRRSSVAAVVVLTLLVAAGMWNRLIERLIFFPTSGVDLRPEQLGVEGRELFLTTEDGVRLHAFFLPADGASRALLFLHGNAGNASHRLPNAAALARLGIHVLLPDYRGYGLSEGRGPSCRRSRRAREAHRHLRALPGRCRRRRPGQGPGARGRDPREHVYVGIRRGPPELRIADELIAFELGRALFEAAPEPKDFETIAGAGHNDTVEVGGQAYFARIGRFIDEVAPQGAVLNE
jgi:pimeloyl-ACP methyl ester carboxylesterase